MRERPIILSTDMVRAVLDGRKTQARRIVKNQHDTPYWSIKPAENPLHAVHTHDWWLPVGNQPHSALPTCPFGVPGDRLWVREKWSVVTHAFSDEGSMIDYVPDRPVKAVHEKPFGNGYYSGHAIYAADGDFTWCDEDGCADGISRWKTSSQMPRWASRITLEVTAVRVERLQDISERDAAAEGVEQLKEGFWRHYQPGWTQHQLSARGSFVTLWNSLYGDDSWQLNPWVWVIEFKREGSES